MIFCEINGIVSSFYLVLSNAYSLIITSFNNEEREREREMKRERGRVLNHTSKMENFAKIGSD